MRGRLSWQRYAAAALLGGMALISILPAPWKGHVASYGPLHSAEHIAAFCAVLLLTCPRPCSYTKLVGVSIALLAFGVAIEALQSVVYGIALEFDDILADLVGIAIGALTRLLQGSLIPRPQP